MLVTNSVLFTLLVIVVKIEGKVLANVILLKKILNFEDFEFTKKNKPNKYANRIFVKTTEIVKYQIMYLYAYASKALLALGVNA